MKKTITGLSLTISLLLISATGWSQGSVAGQAISETERQALFPSRSIIEFGRIAAEANCAGCHGMDGISKAEGSPHIAGQRTVYLYRVLKAFQSGARSDEAKNHNSFLNDEALLSTAVFYSGLTPVSIVKDTEADEAIGEDGELADDPFLSIRSSIRKCVK